MSDHAVLSADKHRALRVRTERGAAYGDGIMAALAVPDEFRQVQAHYPILFRANPERDAFTPLALFGFEDGENLFLENGRWDAAYVPLSIDIQPFLIGRGADTRQVHIDQGSARIIDGEGVRVFDDQGQPTPYLEAILERLGALDEGYQASPSFMDALRRYDLLEPLNLDITLKNGSMHRLVGFHVINESKLRTLDGAVVAELHAEGHLMPIFMALASLSNIGDLVARKQRKLGLG